MRCKGLAANSAKVQKAWSIVMKVEIDDFRVLCKMSSVPRPDELEYKA